MTTRTEATIDDLYRVPENGTLVVWDVDVLREKLVRVYRTANPTSPKIYAAGDMAEAEPALPGWTIRVDEIIG